jgi:hypothetical protein
MHFNLRKYLIGLISLAALLAIYVVYVHISRTPRITIGADEEFVDAPSSSEVDNYDNESGKIGDVGIVGIKKTRFLHRNKFNEVDREFGFEELLHEDENQWEIESPYLNIFLPMLKCYITANRGQVQVETAAGRPSPKDATFTGNVVIHVVPTVDSDIKESFVHLDDVNFASEKASFYTSGPVSFTSDDAEMRGSGLELAYNDELGRLEFFRIVQLDSLLLKSSNAPFLSTATTKPNREVSTASPANSQSISKSTDTKITKEPIQPTFKYEQNTGQYYKCVFVENAVIQTPEQRIYASEGLYLNNIFWLKNKSEKPSTSVISDSNYVEMGDATTLRAIPKDKSSEESSFDVMVHCNGGVVVTPMDSSRVPSDFYGESNVQTYTVDEKGLVDSGDSSKQSVLVTQRIDYDLSRGQTIVIGPLELTFQVDANSVTGMEDKGGGKLLPAKLTAQKEARFFPTSKQLLLEGDCLVEVFSKDPNMDIEEKYTLSAPRLMFDLPKNRNEQKQVSVRDFEHLTADGGPVKLSAIKRLNVDVLGGVELNCDKLDYEPNKQHFAASGPGQIRLNNSKSDQATEQQSLSLRQPCYAFLRDFDLLEYDMKTRTIIADAESQQVVLDYFPIINGRHDKHITATAGHIEINLTQADDGQIELRSLLATDGIFYEDDDNVFVGSKLTYSPDDSGIKITGDDSYSCYFNGVAVDKIEIDMKTGTAKAEVLSAGSFQIDRR